MFRIHIKHQISVIYTISDSTLHCTKQVYQTLTTLGHKLHKKAGQLELDELHVTKLPIKD